MESTTLTRIRSEEHSTLAELANELYRQQETKADYIVDTRRMNLTTGSDGSFLGFDVPGADTEGGMLKDHAHGQIAERIEIPKRYYDRMRSEAPTLLDQNVDHWFHTKPEKRMVRMLDGNVRAFLSNRYRRLDNIDLMEQAILPELAKYEGDLVFHNAALTDTRLYVRAILPGLAADVEAQPGNHTFLDNGGDIVQAGIQIRNSEVGSGQLEVAPFIWRLRCLNGLVMADFGLGKYHIGRSQDEGDYSIYRDDTRAADDKAFFLKVRDAVGAALSDVQFEAIVKSLREAATGEKIVDPVAATEKLAKTYTLAESEQTSILRYLATGGDLSKWGVVNAVTSAAKDADDFERQAELEQLGGVLVALPSAEWTKIAA